MIDRGRLAGLLDSPAHFSAEFFGRRLHRKQVQIRRSVLRHRRTSVRGGTGWGKTFVAADIAADWLVRHWPDAAVIATATRWPQITRQFMGEVRALVRQATGRINLPEPMKERWELAPTCYLQCISPNDEEGAGGYHRKHTLIIIDEASGVDDARRRGLEGAMSAGHAAMVEFGNPLGAMGPFVDHHTRDRGIYNCFSVPVWDTPNFEPLRDMAVKRFGKLAMGEEAREYMLEQLLATDDDELASWTTWPTLTSPVWVKNEAYAFWGVGHPAWQARIESQFPRYSAHALIPLGWIEELVELEPIDDGHSAVSVGIDVAGKGEDETVVTVWCPGTMSILAQYAFPDPKAVKPTIDSLRPWRDRIRIIRYDEIGVGAYFGDPLEAEFESDRCVVMGVNVGSASSDPYRFKNLRAELHWSFRERCEAREVRGFGVVGGEVLEAQTAPIWWDADLQGRTFIAPKKDMPRSPDRFESILYAVGSDSLEANPYDGDPFGFKAQVEIRSARASIPAIPGERRQGRRRRSEF